MTPTELDALLDAAARLSPADSEAHRTAVALRLAAAAPALRIRLQAAETGALANRGSPGGIMASVSKAMSDNMKIMAEAKARGRAEALEDAARACACHASAEAIRSLPGWEPPATTEIPF